MSHVRRFDHVGIAVADRAGLDRLDGLGARVSTCVRSDTTKPRPSCGVSAGGTGLPCGGAEGIRT